MLKIVALVATCALAIGVPFALADEGQSTPEPQTATPSQPRCDRAAEHSALKHAFSRKNWRAKAPLAGVDLSCMPKRLIAKKRAAFRMYRDYRRIAPYRCHSGSEGYYAIPCGIIACESNFRWSARNPETGAAGAYQFMPEWDAPYPARTFRQRLANHRIAASLSLSNWVCA